MQLSPNNTEIVPVSNQDAPKEMVHSYNGIRDSKIHSNYQYMHQIQLYYIYIYAHISYNNYIHVHVHTYICYIQLKSVAYI